MANLSFLENCANGYDSVKNQFDSIGDKIKVLPISIKHSTREHLSICEAINTASGTLDLLTKLDISMVPVSLA